jgi:predicted porin
MQADNPGVTTGGAITTNDASFIAERMRVWGAGVNYTFGPATVGLAYSNSNYKNPTANGYISTTAPLVTGATLNTLKFQNIEVNGKYQITPTFYVGAEYVYTIENFDASTGNLKPKIQTVGLMADYNLSKRTDVYIQGVYQKVGGDKTNSVLDDGFVLGTDAPSSTSSQTVVRVALRHQF